MSEKNVKYQNNHMILSVIQVLIMLKSWILLKNKLIDLLTELRDFKFVTTLVLESKMIQTHDKTLYNTFYLNSKAEIIIIESDIDDVFKSIFSTII